MKSIFEKVRYYFVEIISALVFFVGFTIVGFLMRLFSKTCRMDTDKTALSYWRIIRLKNKDK